MSINENGREIEFPVFSEIPQALTAYDQWVTWDFGSDAIVQVEEPTSARQAYENGLETGLGLGFMLNADDPFVVAELYDAVDVESRKPKPWAYALMRELDSYAEIDHSILRVFMTGRAENQQKDNIAIYGSDLLIPVTGNAAGTHVEIQSCQVEIDVFTAKYLEPTILDVAKDMERRGMLDKDMLGALLDRLFQDKEWHEQSEIMPFLAKCRSYPDLYLRIHGKIQMWRGERKDAFLKRLDEEMPKKDAKEKPRLRRSDQVQAGGEVDIEGILQVDARGKAKETVYNIAMILQHHPEWKGRFRFDMFGNTSILDKRPVTDAVEANIAIWLGDNYGFGGNNPKWVTRGIYAAGIQDSYDPLQEWILSLPKWDGNDRLNTWMIDFCGSPADKIAVPWISRVSILQMVSRAINPGCMGRLVPVWEGPENRGKTRGIKLLGDPWSITFDMSMDSKEAHMAMAGTWVAELAELDTLRKTSETRLRSFISQQEDSYVPKFSNHLTKHPRRTVFFGTTNEKNYLRGKTGNTRWLPIETTYFDLEGLARVRNQLFAEALCKLEESPDAQWWEPPPRIRQIIDQDRDERREINVYEDALAEWLKVKEEVKWVDIARDFLQLENPAGWRDRSMQMQIADVLTILKWEKRHTDKGNVWVKGAEA